MDEGRNSMVERIMTTVMEVGKTGSDPCQKFGGRKLFAMSGFGVGKIFGGRKLIVMSRFGVCS